MDHKNPLHHERNFGSFLSLATLLLFVLFFAIAATFPGQTGLFKQLFPKPSSFGQAEPLIGDINQDGRVNVFDLGILMGNYGKSTASAPDDATLQRCDVKLDGIINIFDLGVLGSNYGQGGTGSPTPTAFPGTLTPTPTSTGPTPTAPAGAVRGVWLSPQEITQLPTTGTGWDHVKGAADGSVGTPNIANQDSEHDTNTLAIALVYVRLNDANYRNKAAQAIKSAVGTEQGARTLALGRNLASYVIAADLIDLKSLDPSYDSGTFRPWLKKQRDALISTHEDRPNNWGTHAGSSRTAADVYLGDTADLARSAQVLHGWLGDRSAYSGFQYGDLDWQCNPAQPVGINPPGCTRSDHSIDGVLPDDQRRSGGFGWPPPKANYVYGGLSGAIVQAEILHRAGYDTWNWNSQALLRAYKWLHEQANFPAGGDDEWQPFLVNHVYHTSFPAHTPASTGKHMGWTDWTHAR